MGGGLYLLFLCGRDCVSLTVLFTDKSWRELGVGKKQDDFQSFHFNQIDSILKLFKAVNKQFKNC